MEGEQKEEGQGEAEAGQEMGGGKRARKCVKKSRVWYTGVFPSREWVHLNLYIRAHADTESNLLQ